MFVGHGCPVLNLLLEIKPWQLYHAHWLISMPTLHVPLKQGLKPRFSPHALAAHLATACHHLSTTQAPSSSSSKLGSAEMPMTLSGSGPPSL